MPETNSILNATRTAFKWEQCRDSVKKIFLIDKEKGEQEYINRMTLMQKVIKGYAEVHNVDLIEAVIEICKHEDGMGALQFLAAAYELCSGTDFTIKSE